jgi:hypothetical protein
MLTVLCRIRLGGRSRHYGPSMLPKRPSEPARDGLRAVKSPEATEVEMRTTSYAVKSEVEPVWQALLDVTVWRSRPW